MSFFYDVVGLGLNAVDFLTVVEKYPPPGGKCEIKSFRVLPGGQVATAMICVKKLGIDGVKYLGKVGDDYTGKISYESLKKSGIDISGVKIVKNCTNQFANIVIDGKSGERTIMWKRDKRLQVEIKDYSVDEVCSGKILHLDGHDTETASFFAKEAKKRGIITTLDIDRVYENVDNLLENIDYIITSENFPKNYSGEEIFEKALILLKKKFKKSFVAATCGDRGVYYVTEHLKVRRIPAFKIVCVDSTGAGDVFHGGFIYGLLKKWDMEKTLLFSNGVAALNCLKYGARGNLLSEEEVWNFIKKFF